MEMVSILGETSVKGPLKNNKWHCTAALNNNIAIMSADLLEGLLLDRILQNMVRHFVTHKPEINDTIFMQRITAGSGTDLH